MKLGRRMIRIPENEDDLITVEAEARLSGKRIIVQCPRCGERYQAGLGHYGSDYCLVAVTTRTLEATGIVVISASYKAMLDESGVFNVFHPNAGITYGVGFKRVKAKTRLVTYKWAANYLKATRSVQGYSRWSRKRRIKDLKLLNDRPEYSRLREAITTLPISNIRRILSYPLEEVMQRDRQGLLIILLKYDYHTIDRRMS